MDSADSRHAEGAGHGRAVVQRARCHGRLADFARETRVLRDGVATGRPVADLLRTHGGLPSTRIQNLVGSLQRGLGALSAGY